MKYLRKINIDFDNFDETVEGLNFEDINIGDYVYSFYKNYNNEIIEDMGWIFNMTLNGSNKKVIDVYFYGDEGEKYFYTINKDNIIYDKMIIWRDESEVLLYLGKDKDTNIVDKYREEILKMIK